MTTLERNTVLKTALWLVLMEGWATADAAAARLNLPVGEITRSLDLLEAGHWVQRSVAKAEGITQRVVQWVVTRSFEELWAELMPDRPCPVRIGGGVKPVAH